ncbi:SurA N-terminal domain-containing protein [Spirochaetota bacterium]
MFDSRSKATKIVGYAVVSFFVLIIALSFGMPDFMSRMGMDKSIVAVVNGEKVHIQDFVRYRDRFKDVKGKDASSRILNRYISEMLLLQEAKKYGFKITDERIVEIIRRDPGFINPNTGEFDLTRFKWVLRRIQMSQNDYQKYLKKNLIRNELIQFLKMGIAVPSDEINNEYVSKKSKLRIKYAFLSNKDLKKKFRNQINASNAEISKEMEKNKKSVKNLKSERRNIRKKIEKIKLKKLKNKIKSKINKIAQKNGSFNSAAAILRGKVAISNVFSINEQPRENKKNGKPLFFISKSKIFTQGCLSIKNGNTSKVITAFNGLYIFTPILKKIKFDTPSKKETTLIAKNIESRTLDMVYLFLLYKLNEKSKITKNLKTN